MKRRMLAAVLLPLPFAALPVAAVLVGAASTNGNGGLVVQTPMPLERPAEQVLEAGGPGTVTADGERAAEPLAYSTGEPDQCSSRPGTEG